MWQILLRLLHYGMQSIIPNSQPCQGMFYLSSPSNPLMARKWCTDEFEVAKKRCPILSGHSLNFKVTQADTLMIFTRTERFWAVNPIWIHKWLQNDAQSLEGHKGCALLFFYVVRQISRLHGLKIDNLTPQHKGFQMTTLIWIHRWLICLISKSHRPKNRRLWPWLNIIGQNSSMCSQMATKWCTKRKVT